MLLEIIKSNIGDEDVNSVNARDLYSHLKVKTDFSHWIKRAIKKYDFVENEDYLTIDKKDGRQILKDYIITLDMAKELAMTENNAKGKETRKYFIKCEKEFNKPKTMTVEELLAYNMKVISNIKAENLVLKSANETMKPKALFADSVASSKASILIGQYAKLISGGDFVIGQNRLFTILRENGFLHKSGARRNQPLQKYIDNNVFETVERTVNNPDGSVRITITTKITGKGQVYLIDKIKEIFKKGLKCTM